MASDTPNHFSQQHLRELLSSAQRTAGFMQASMAKFSWPLSEDFLANNRDALEVFEPLAAINERFGKLQDLLGSAMRHACLLLGEPSEPFLKVLGFFAKVGVVDSSEDWIVLRQLRNAAAHDYGTRFADTARHFNAIHAAHPALLKTLQALARYAEQELGVTGQDPHFQ